MTIRKSRRRAVVLGYHAQNYRQATLLPNTFKTTAQPAPRQIYGGARAMKNGNTYYGKARPHGRPRQVQELPAAVRQRT